MTTIPSDRAHARLAPSSAHRWLKCPGSVRLSEGLPDTESSYASEGTAAHHLAEKCMTGGKDAIEWKGWTIDTKVAKGLSPWFRPDYPGVKADGKTRFEVDANMADAVQLYLDVAREIAEGSDEFDVEQRLDLDDIINGVFGTGDTVAYREKPTRRVSIVDYKHGQGVAVEVENNKQLLTYALAVLKRFHNRGVDEVEIVIVQPRSPHRDGAVRRWVTDQVGLYEHAMALQDAAQAVNDPDARLVPGSWCRFCKGAPVCPALADRVMTIIGSTGRDALGNLTMADPTKYDADTLAQKLTDLPLVLTWLKGVEQFGHAEAMSGRMPPGWKLVAKRATRKWRNEDDAAMALQIAGVDEGDIYKTEMRTPADVEKSIPRAERATLLGELTHKNPSGTSLAPVDDPRPSVDPHDARGFEAVEIGER